MRFIAIAIFCAVFTMNLKAEVIHFKNFEVKNKLFKEYPGAFSVQARDGRNVRLEENYRTTKEGGIKDNPLYKMVVKKVKEELLKKANTITDGTIKYNESFDLGDTNFPGFNWSGLVAGTGVHAGRKLYPDYTAEGEDERWVVEDQLQLEIDAQTFLKSQLDSGNIDITLPNLKAFAGIRFRRTYTYIHHADTYKKGLTKEFDKLFLGFLKFGSTKFLTLEDHESITRQDFMSADVGANIGTPSYYFLSAYAGGTLYYNRVNNVSIHKPGERDFPRGDELLRISVNKSKLSGTSVTTGLQADFYSLLKISLLSFEYSKTLSQNIFISMSFLGFDEVLLENKDSVLHQEVKDVLRGKLPKNNLILMPYIVSEQETKRDSESMRSHLFLFDKLKGSSTSEVTLRNADGTKYLFRHNEEKTTFRKTWLQALVSSKKLDKYKRRTTDTVNLEYQVREDQRGFDLADVKLDNPGQAYLRFSKEVNAPKTKGRFRKKLRNELIAFGKYYTNIDDKVWNMFKKGEMLRGDATVSINAEINGVGIANIAPTTVEEWAITTRWICLRVTPNDDPGRLNKDEKKCLKKLKNSFASYKKVWNEEIKISAWALKELISAIAEYARGFDDLELVFGQENVGISGSFSAETFHGFPYVTYFLLGQDQGNGLIQDSLQ